MTPDGQMFYSAQYGHTKVPTKQLHRCILNENKIVMYGQIQHLTVLSESLVTFLKFFNTLENFQDHFELTFRLSNFQLVHVHLSSVHKLVPLNMISKKCIFINNKGHYLFLHRLHYHECPFTDYCLLCCDHRPQNHPSQA